MSSEVDRNRRASPELLLRPGDVVGDSTQADRFVLRQHLGHGSAGRVFRATDTIYERDVALKFLLVGSDFADREWAIHEAKALARIRHPNVVVVYEVVADVLCPDGTRLPPYLVMEYVEGVELKAILGSSKRSLDAEQLVRVMRSVAGALVACHRARILHRDLKPANILLSNDGGAKLIDFGIAARQHTEAARPVAGYYRSFLQAGVPGPHGKPAGRSPSLPEAAPEDEEGSRPREEIRRSEASAGDADEAIGTPYFMAPEVWREERVDERADLFSFGVTFFRAFTGKYPVAAESVVDLRRRLLSGVPLPKVREVRPEVPATVADVIDAALVLDRRKRVQSAEELLRAVDHVQRTGARLLPTQPYVGLRPFQDDDHGVFYGREVEVLYLVTRLQTERVLTLLGESGAGKSSLALAGLGPAVASGDLDDHLTWTVEHLVPGAAPVDALAKVLAHFVSQDTNTLKRSLLEDPEGFVRNLATSPKRSRGRRGPKARRGLLLIIDQLEELVTISTDGMQRLTVGRFVEAVRTTQVDLRLVLTVREDYVSRLASIPGLVDALEVLHLVRPLDGEALRAAVTAPARAFGFQFEGEAMVDAIIDEVSGRAGGLPLLQFALEKLWENRDEDGKIIPQHALDALGGVGPALAEFAEQVWEQLARDGDDVLADQALLALITPEGTKRTRSLEELRYGIGDDDQRIQAVIEHLRQSRLVVGSDQILELAHEALITHWAHLRHLVDRTRTERELAEEAHRAALRWSSRDRPPALLWRGPDVQAAARLFPTPRLGGAPGRALGAYLSPEACRFIYASHRHERSRRRLRRLGYAVLLLLLPVAVATVLFLVQLTRERDKTAHAYSRAQAEQGRAERAALVAKQAAEQAAESAREAHRKERQANHLAAAVSKRYDQLEEAIRSVLARRRLNRSSIEHLARLVLESRAEVQRLLERMPLSKRGWGSHLSKRRHVSAGTVMSERPRPRAVDLSPELRRIVQRNWRQIRYCYRQVGLLENPRLHGRLQVRIDIAPAGTVTRVDTLEDTLKHPPTVRCIIAKIKAWHFFETAKGIQGFEHTFHLFPTL